MAAYEYFQWIKDYKREYLRGDLTAGLTVGVMLIPQGMAYAMLAGLPPIYGLYTVTIPLIIYALLGSSRQLAVGPVALISLLVASSIGSLAEAGSDQYIHYALTLSLMVGLFLTVMSVFRLGFLVNFLSHPVITGFTSAAALIIIASQLKHIFGFDIPRGGFLEMVSSLSSKLSSIQVLPLVIGVSAIVGIKVINKIDKRIPAALIVVVLSIWAVKLFGFEEQGLRLIGAVPEGIPSFTVPSFDLSVIRSLLPFALTISFIGFMESIAVAKAIQKKHKDYKVIPNQELMALGIANIAGSFFQSYPVVGGFGRSAVNNDAGAKSGLASIISALLIILTLLFFTTLFQKLPMAILAAIIIVAVINLIDIKEVRHLWNTDRKDFWLFIITALGTLILGIEEGIILGVVLSLLVMISRASYPHIAQLGQIPDETTYRNLSRFENLISYPSIVIIRIDARIFFANQDYIKEYILQAIDKSEVQNLVLDFIAVNGVDSTGMHMLNEINDTLIERNILLHMVDVKGPIRDIMKRNNLFDPKHKIKHYLTVHDAVQCIQNSDVTTSDDEYVFQTNPQN